MEFIPKIDADRAEYVTTTNYLSLAEVRRSELPLL